MSNVPKNECSPASLFGGFQHHLFLGCSVVSFSSNVGWGGQATEITVQLIEDPCPTPDGSPKVYWDYLLQPQTTTGADPGFLGTKGWVDNSTGVVYIADEAADPADDRLEIVGCPVCFRVGDFEFAGIIQSWEEGNSSSGRPLYSVKISDPREILEGSQIIVGGYSGSVGEHYNVFNVFGFMESLGITCPQTSLFTTPPDVANWVIGDVGVDGTTFGSVAGGYGGAFRNNNGTQATAIINSFNVLANSIPKNSSAWSPYGRVVFKAPNGTEGGYGLMDYDVAGVCEFFVDISELPTLPSYWRIQEDSISIMQLVSEICDAAGYDFYIELLPINQGIISTIAGSGIAKFIKIRTVERLNVRALTSIESFIGSSDGVISNSIGQELRNDDLSALVVGGNKLVQYQINLDELSDETSEDDTILPYFGLDSDGNAIIPYKDEDRAHECGEDADGNPDLVAQWMVDLETTEINAQLKHFVLPDTVTIREMEFRTVLKGMSEWKLYLDLEFALGDPTDIGNIIGFILSQLDADVLKVAEDFNINPANRDMVARADFIGQNGGLGLVDLQQDKVNDVVAIYQWLSNIANTYYGKQFQVRVPYTCGQYDDVSGSIVLSEHPSSNGYTEQSSILDLSIASLGMSLFRNEDGTYSPFLMFNGASLTELSQLSIGEYYVDVAEDKIWIRASIENDYVYINRNTLASPRIVFGIPNALHMTKREQIQKVMMLEEMNRVRVLDNGGNLAARDAAIQEIREQMKGIGFQAVIGEVPSCVNFPDGATCGIESNIQKYGPWSNPGPPGRTKIINDDTLVPWEYGNYETMNLAGQALCDAGLTNMQVQEKGSITIAGYPTVPLGAELGAVAGGFFGAGTNLIENRTHSTDSYSSPASVPFSANYGFFNYGGAWTGAHGPNVTGITVEVGPQGLQTSYTMASFTPKFGRLSHLNAKRLRESAKVNNKVNQNTQRFLRKKLGELNVKAQNKQKAAGAQFADNIIDAIKPKTPNEVLFGQTIPWLNGKRRTIITLNPMYDAQWELIDCIPSADKTGKAYASLDCLIRPISMDGDGDLPRFIIPANNCQLHSSKGMQPPVYNTTDDVESYDIDIDIDYLNPFTNPTGFSRSSLSVNRTDTPDMGHDIDIIGRLGTDGDAAPSYITCAVDGREDTTHRWDYKDDYRAFALRGPLILQSWGYDLDGKPVPNKADTEIDASGGIFTEEDLEDKFLDNHLGKAHTWPVAPVDLRLDRARGVWVAPPAHKLLNVTLVSELAANSSCIATVNNSDTLYDADGIEMVDPYITIHDIFGQSLPIDSSVVAYYNPETCEYWNLTSPGITETRLALAGSGIPARVSATVGSATVDEYKLVGDTLTVTGSTFTAKNNSEHPIPAGTYIVCNKEPISREWVVQDLLLNLIEDLTPQLGGNLDVLARSIFTSTTDGNIQISPNGTGAVLIGDAHTVTSSIGAIVAGWSHVAVQSNYGAIFGYDNSRASTDASTGDSCIIAGAINYGNTGNFCAIFGSGNWKNTGDSCLIAGHNNINNSGRYCLIAGQDHDNNSGDYCSISGRYNYTNSGINTLICGRGNQTNSGSYCLISGLYNYNNTGTGTLICGMDHADNDGLYCIIAGQGHYNNTGGWSAIFGDTNWGNAGIYNVIGGQGHTENIGTNNAIFGYANLSNSGSYSLIAGRQNSSNAGSHSLIVGRANASNSGSNCVISGYYVSNALNGAIAHANGRFAAAGDAQIRTLVARNNTTNGTATNLYLNGSSERLTIATDTCWAFNIMIVASESGMAKDQKFCRQGVLVNDGGTVTISGIDTIGTDQALGAAAWTIAVTADNTNKALDIKVTGASSTNIRWVAKVELVETKYA